MATITSTGVGSGLDVEAIVTQLMAIESRPLALLEDQESDLNTQLSAIGSLQSRMSSLKDTASALTSLTLWKSTTSSTSDAASVGVSSSTGAVVGSYAVEVQQLATVQTVASSAFAGSDSTFGAGTLTFELGSYSGEPTPTGFTSSASAVQVAVAEGDTLATVRDKINAAGAGVIATIISDASGARLALTSSATGVENAFRVVASETVDDGNVATGLSALAFDATTGSPMTRSQTAVNALATVNGIAIESASNTLDETIEGMTITLIKQTTGPVDLAVSADADSVEKAITAFVSAFNDVARYIHDTTQYNPDSQEGGTLQGDRIVTTLQSQLRNLVNEDSTASSVFTRLSDIGISFGSDGLLTTDATQLDAALGNLPELQKLLATDGADSAGSGYIDRFKDFASAALGVDGTFETRNESLNAQLEQNSDQQDSMELRLQQTEARLRRQYQALDTQMSTLNSLSSYLTQQLASLTLDFD